MGWLSCGDKNLGGGVHLKMSTFKRILGSSVTLKMGSSSPKTPHLSSLLQIIYP